LAHIRNTRENIRENNNKREIKERKTRAHVAEDFSFFNFFNQYDKKQSEVEAQQEWNKMTEQERRTAMSNVLKYVISTEDKIYRLNPAKWLREKRYNDEVPLTDAQHAKYMFELQRRQDGR